MDDVEKLRATAAELITTARDLIDRVPRQARPSDDVVRFLASKHSQEVERLSCAILNMDDANARALKRIEESQKRIEARLSSLEDYVSRSEAARRFRTGGMISPTKHRRNRQRAQTPKGIRLDEVELSYRVENCLKSANIETVDQVNAMTDAELLRISNFGRKSLRELRAVMQAIG